MSERKIRVSVDLQGHTVFVGHLYARERKGRESASFEYDATWLQHPFHFALEPALSLGRGLHHTPSGRALFGSIGDSAPDRWGRGLMRRAERHKAKLEGREPRHLAEIDFLLQVDDTTRPGALRFSEQPEGPFLKAPDEGLRVPLFIELPRLLNAADHLLREEEDDNDLRALLAPGSSLGGARPKASVCDQEGHLFIAKFPHPQDEINLPAWEALALRLALQSGISVPNHRLEVIAHRSVLLLERFDRKGRERIPFLSGMSLLGASDNESHSYIEIAEALRRYSGEPNRDLAELWRRIVFSVLVSNGDDHLRNHGLLWPDGRGWRLSPAYDLNPTPVDVRPRLLTTAIDEDDNTASLDLAFSVAERFGLTPAAARTIAGEVGRPVALWRKEALHLGLSLPEIQRMASAFEHQDLQQAKVL